MDSQVGLQCVDTSRFKEHNQKTAPMGAVFVFLGVVVCKSMSKHFDTNYDVVVIGGGASGMMCAGKAAESGARVLVLEKNKEMGKKLKISGGGRCNITNAEFDPKKFLEHFPQAKKFLYTPFAKFAVQDTFDFFERLGLPIVVEARNRAFPKSQKATDVSDTLEQYMREAGVTVRTRVKVKGLEVTDEGDFIVETNKHQYRVPYCVVATGGLAAPETGSTGDGFKFLRTLGHTVTEPNPNIVPLTTDAHWVHSLSGLSLSFMRLRFIQNDKIHITKVGKILFTHFGISGPLVLNSAYEVTQLLRHGSVDASIDLFPDTEIGDINRRLLNLFNKNKNKLVKNVLPDLIPEQLSDIILNAEGLVIAEKEVNSVTKEERNLLAHILKDLRFPITGTLGFDKAVIADGGVALEEINFKTMESKLHPNLFLLGDILNVNRPSGGFSLQLCWTTAWVAGKTIAGKFRTDQR